MTTSTIFDLETTAQSDAELALIRPEFEAPKNYVDPIKIAASIKAQEVTWKEQAALSAVTGRILCIGTVAGDEPKIIQGDEKAIVQAFWDNWSTPGSGFFIGWNCKGFDIPFLVRRSWALKVPVPHDVFEGRYLSSRIVDLMDVWTCGNRDQRESLDTVSKALGVGAKNGEGKDFGRLWVEDRPKALEYVTNDLKLTAAIAVRMGMNV